MSERSQPGALAADECCSRCGATKDRCTGHAWARPQETAVCMAYDAFRICLGQPPQNFTPVEVQRWMECMS
jgi:hypothetical protein